MYSCAVIGAFYHNFAVSSIKEVTAALQLSQAYVSSVFNEHQLSMSWCVLILMFNCLLCLLVCSLFTEFTVKLSEYQANKQVLSH